MSLPGLAVRWSELEARKPYASPFGVTFLDAHGGSAGGIAVSGADLLYYHQFQQAVLRLGGELFSDPDLSAGADAQLAWLDRLSGLLPQLELVEIVPRSVFDERAAERRFMFTVHATGAPDCAVDATVLLEYQELQAALAHHTGRLYRNRDIESIADTPRRRAAWFEALRTLVRRPGPDEAMATEWPWR